MNSKTFIILDFRSPVGQVGAMVPMQAPIAEIADDRRRRFMCDA